MSAVVFIVVSRSRRLILAILIQRWFLFVMPKNAIERYRLRPASR